MDGWKIRTQFFTAGLPKVTWWLGVLARQTSNLRQPFFVDSSVWLLAAAITFPCTAGARVPLNLILFYIVVISS